MADRDERGLFKPGNQIGKLGGRPKSALDFRTALGPEHVEKLLEIVRAGVAGGDAKFVQMAIDRLWPALARTELSGVEGKPIELAQAEQVAAELPTDVLRELDALAERVKAATEAVESIDPPDAIRH